MFREAESYVRRHHVGMLALFVALGGTSYAATSLPRNSVGSPQLRAGAVHATDVADGAITLRKLDGAMRRRLSGQATAAGPQGPAGPEGPAGPKGDTGAADSSNVFTKAESDARFLGLGATAANSTLLAGMPASTFIQGTGSIRSFARAAAGLDPAIFDVGARPAARPASGRPRSRATEPVTRRRAGTARGATRTSAPRPPPGTRAAARPC